MADKNPAHDPAQTQGAARPQQPPSAQGAPQQPPQHDHAAAQLRQAGLADDHHPQAQHAIARGVKLTTILDAIRKYGASVLDLIQQITADVGGAQPAAQPRPPAHTP